ncbi:MAG TPA: hypothetical protein VGS28_04010 [Candidatus Saccharimonadales bacterium]|nr:hypothetical protein [Candidatus Saccharimonadales bacterium]
MTLDKGKINHYLKQFLKIRIWQLILATIVFGLLSIYLLRQNNLGMITRRTAVVRADQENGNVAGALSNLRAYMMDHMNTRMSQPLELQYSYQRVVEKLTEQAASSNTVADPGVYQQAQAACVNSDYIVYAQCVIDKTRAAASGTNPNLFVHYPPVALFSYQFYSPTWSPDLAGFSVLVTFLLALLIVVRAFGEQLGRWFLRRHV